MNDLKINTYTDGYKLKTTRDVTKREFILLCNMLGDKFNEHYNTTEYVFAPEPVVEGGIIFSNFNTPDVAYKKTMRLFPETFSPNSYDKGSLYGFIYPNVKETWIYDNSKLIEAGTTLGTCLKSFHNAPAWTKYELMIFKECFSDFGVVITKVPTKTSLKRHSNPKYYLDLFSSVRDSI